MHLFTFSAAVAFVLAPFTALGAQQYFVPGATAAVIMVARPNATTPASWTIKLRLGQSAPPVLTLHSLRITDWDPSFGGRWNAGSNKRGGGTQIDPESYVAHLRARLIEARVAKTA